MEMKTLFEIHTLITSVGCKRSFENRKINVFVRRKLNKYTMITFVRKSKNNQLSCVTVVYGIYFHQIFRLSWVENQKPNEMFGKKYPQSE